MIRALVCLNIAYAAVVKRETVLKPSRYTPHLHNECIGWLKEAFQIFSPVGQKKPLSVPFLTRIKTPGKGDLPLNNHPMPGMLGRGTHRRSPDNHRGCIFR